MRDRNPTLTGIEKHQLESLECKAIVTNIEITFKGLLNGKKKMMAKVECKKNGRNEKKMNTFNTLTSIKRLF